MQGRNGYKIISKYISLAQWLSNFKIVILNDGIITIKFSLGTQGVRL